MLCMRLAAQSVSGFAFLPDSVLEGDLDWGDGSHLGIRTQGSFPSTATAFDLTRADLT